MVSINAFRFFACNQIVLLYALWSQEAEGIHTFEGVIILAFVEYAARHVQNIVHQMQNYASIGKLIECGKYETIKRTELTSDSLIVAVGNF